LGDAFLHHACICLGRRPKILPEIALGHIGYGTGEHDDAKRHLNRLWKLLDFIDRVPEHLIDVVAHLRERVIEVLVLEEAEVHIFLDRKI
jgi:hypothetical protein